MKTNLTALTALAAAALAIAAPVAMAADGTAPLGESIVSAPAPAPAQSFSGLFDSRRFAVHINVNDVISSGLWTFPAAMYQPQMTQGNRLNFEVGASYYLTKSLSFEVATTPLAVNNPTAFMMGPTGAFGYKPTSLDLEYHFDPVFAGQFTPYLGAGATYMQFSGASIASQNFFVTPGSAWGENVQVGGDYMLGDHWSVNLNVRKYFVKTSWQEFFALGVGSAAPVNNVSLSPVFLGAGIGYRF